MRPLAIIWFERLSLAALALDLVNNLLNWQQTAASLAARGLPSSPILVFAISLFSPALGLLFWYLISRRASNIARWLFTVLIAMATIVFVAALGTGLAAGISAALLIAAISEVLKIAAATRLFKSEAQAWFARSRRARPCPRGRRLHPCLPPPLPPYSAWESGGQCSRQPGQVRKEAAVTNSRWVVPGSHLSAEAPNR